MIKLDSSIGFDFVVFWKIISEGKKATRVSNICVFMSKQTQENAEYLDGCVQLRAVLSDKRPWKPFLVFFWVAS